jgi:hypothetical protein
MTHTISNITPLIRHCARSPPSDEPDPGLPHRQSERERERERNVVGFIVILFDY